MVRSNASQKDIEFPILNLGATSHNQFYIFLRRVRLYFQSSGFFEAISLKHKSNDKFWLVTNNHPIKMNFESFEMKWPIISRMVNKLSKRANHNRDQTNHYSDWLSDAREQSKLIGQDMCIILIHSRMRKSQRHTYHDLYKDVRVSKRNKNVESPRCPLAAFYIFLRRVRLYINYELNMLTHWSFLWPELKITG